MRAYQGLVLVEMKRSSRGAVDGYVYDPWDRGTDRMNLF